MTSARLTAGTGSTHSSEPAPHPFDADCHDPGYRSRCITCGKESRNHPYYRVRGVKCPNS